MRQQGWGRGCEGPPPWLPQPCRGREWGQQEPRAHTPKAQGVRGSTRNGAQGPGARMLSPVTSHQTPASNATCPGAPAATQQELGGEGLGLSQGCLR